VNPIQHVKVKIFALDPVPELGGAIPVFQRWIRDRVCPEMLIDVADYRHVPNGPGVLLMGHEASYTLDSAKGRLGLLYTRRQAGGDAEENLRQAYDAATAACRRLETEPEFAGKLKFDFSGCEISINDRLLAPNVDGTFDAVKPELERFAKAVAGAGSYSIERRGEPRDLFSISLKIHAKN
jgi:hypothetical protein